MDWDRIIRDHATGRYTDGELAAKHGTNRAVIHRRRTEDRLENPAAWPVDRTKEVRQATAALLLAEATKQTLAQGTDAQAVLAAAGAVKDVILGHRKQVQKAAGVAMRLMDELDATTTHREALEAILETVSKDLEGDAAALLRVQFREFIKLHARVGSIQKLADSLQRLQGLERKAFGIADDEKAGNPLDAMSVPELEAEMRRLDARLAALAIGQDRAPGAAQDGEEEARPSVH